MPIGQKLFEEKFRPTGGAIKSIGSEGVESEFSINSEIIGFGKAEGFTGTNYGNSAQPSTARWHRNRNRVRDHDA